MVPDGGTVRGAFDLALDKVYILAGKGTRCGR